MQAARPSAWWYGGAGAIFVGGLAVFIWLLVSGIAGAQQGFQRGVVPGPIQVQVEQPGKYTIYYEFQSVIDGKVYSTGDAFPPLRVTVTEKATGADVPVSGATVNENYHVNSQAGRSLMAFQAEHAGTYILTGAYTNGAATPEVVLAVGRGFAGHLVATIFTAIGVLFVAIGGAVAIAIVTFIRRRRLR